MLIEFSVTNYRSFLTTQSLTLAANTATELQEENTFPSPVSNLPRLLRSAVVYGPNAAGKSNLIQAIGFMKRFVLSSAKESQEGEKINVTPFLFSEENRGTPSEFEVLFIQAGVRYQYGFAVNSQRVTGEWLFAYPEGRVQKWFERNHDPESQKDVWYFGPKLTGRKKVWQEATRSNALFLSTAIQLNNEQLKPVFNWFDHKLHVIGQGESIAPAFSAGECEEEDKKKKILEFMNAADLSITDISLEKKEFSMEDLPSDMPQKLKEEIGREFEGKKFTRVFLMHPSSDSGEGISLELNEESAGTRKLFALAGPWLDVLDNGFILFVDELDTSLHPLLVRFLLNLFHNSETNPNNAQLIFATHDTTILDQTLMRRDQVWFIEKDEENASRLYPLSDYRPRKGEALQKGYLYGRYGALPFPGELRF
ncbi:MAG: ATP-binding protein [Deltaproteobacteria bacterium]|nr:ATP-binding protein [Deltaproteobacteria bacterium]MBW1949370.1 ATP-binding protein [Deltaproteobacteria bacterium]MBW2007691.1 ATP-binding protein [Deltaproteobacteria bacterium]